jgi:fructose-1-phosphate kinase PfkB-like protein
MDFGLERVLCVIGLNAALQETLFFDSFEVGAVNRVSTLCHGIGGKGQNAACAVHWMKDCYPPAKSSKVYLFSFIGCCETLVTLLHAPPLNETIVNLIVDISPQRTRTSTTLLVKDVPSINPINGTELIQPSPILGKQKQEEMIALIEEKMRAVMAKSQSSVVLICGTLPTLEVQTPAEYYTSIICALRSLEKTFCHKVWIVLDAWKELGGIVTTKGNVDILKVNKQEAKFLAKSIEKGYDCDDEIGVFKVLVSSLCIQFLVVTNGGNDGICIDVQQSCVKMKREAKCFLVGFRIFLPKINVVNAVGCGDTCTAILGVVLNQQQTNKIQNSQLTLEEMKNALHCAFAAASAAAKTLQTALFSTTDYWQIYNAIRVEDL